MDNSFTSEEFAFYEALLDKFPGDKNVKSGTEADVICPAHDDHRPSLGIDLCRNGVGPKLLFNCRSRGCTFEDIRDAANLRPEDYEFGRNGKHPGKAEVPGCTLEEYAHYKNLPVEFLTGEEVGLEEGTWSGKPAVSIPYPDREGNVKLHRFRTGLKKTEPDTRIRSEKGKNPILYGLHRLEEAYQSGYVLLVEGESDCHILWYHNIPAIGIPGAKNWKDEWANHLDGIDVILVCVEPDEAGEQMFSQLAACTRIYSRLEKVRFTDAV